MKNMKVLSVLLLSGFFFLFSCQKEPKFAVPSDLASSTTVQDEYSSKADLIDHYMQVIETQKKNGSSVVFQDGEKFVENPSRAWVVNKVNEKNGGEDCEYCYQFEYRATIVTTSANYEAYSTSSPFPLLWTQSVTHPLGGWPANTVFISNWLCPGVTTPPCIRILWDMGATGHGYADYFKVRICKPSGATSTVSAINYPIPSTDNSLGPWCPTAEECCNIELVQECVQDENGCWYTQMTPMFNGVPIVRGDINSPCKTSWDILPAPSGPKPGCPWPATPWQNNNPILFPECTNWMVTIICGECTYQEMGISNCFADCGG